MKAVPPHGLFDNSAGLYKSIGVEPLAAAMGAEITGVKLPELDNAAFAEVREALFRHKMIYFRDQVLDHAQQAAFASRFGPFAEDAYTSGVPGHPNVHPVIREADAKSEVVFGSGWHVDSPFLSAPPTITMLYAVEIPPYGGDTIWANAALAYASLSPVMQDLLAPLKVRMSMPPNALAFATNKNLDNGDVRAAPGPNLDLLPEDVARKVKGSLHPLVQTHPATGEKALYCDAVYTAGIDGMSAAEAAPILDFLLRHITHPAFTCRLRWAPGTFALWDNRLCVHQAFNDTEGYRRELYRTTVTADILVGAKSE